ncbi:MAG: hypothetical protein M1819_000737 [Sarea resinae]|nr:MAG: hypothetical protein M1819_000737 [Sarea resinae]
MVATRSLQLTVKKATRQQKTLEGSLLMLKDGERTAISSRVAELDQIMPQYLGVSRAILDSVIFCHQDESLWPMSEPSVLKKKFDEIFEALKYTKAIDNIKVLRKKQNEELAKYKIMEQHSKEDKDKADKAEKRSQELADEIEALRDETLDLNRQIKQISEESQESWDHAHSFTGDIETLKAKRIAAQAKQESVNDLRLHIKEMTDTDEELTSILEQYEDRMSLYEGQIASRRERYDELKGDIEQNRRLLGAKQTEVGKFEAEKTHFEQQIARRESMIKETARRHNIRGFDDELDDPQIHDFMEKISKMSRDQNIHLERARAETKNQLQDAQDVLNQLGQRRSALSERKNAARQQIASNDRKFEEFHAELDKIDIDEGGKATLESSLHEVESKLRKSKEDYDAAAWEQKIQDANAEFRSLEDAQERLKADMLQASRQAEQSARLNFLKKERKELQQSLDVMVKTHGGRVTDMIGHDWEIPSLERDFQAALELRKAALDEAEKQRSGISRELEQVEFKLGASRNDLKKKREEAQRCESHVLKAMQDEGPIESYPEVLAEVQDGRDVRKHDVDSFGHFQKFYLTCISKAKDENKCHLCTRRFDVVKQRSDFLAMLEKLISKGGQDIVEKEYRELEEDLKSLREAGSSYDNWKRLSGTELPALEREVKKLESRRETLLNEIEDHDRVVTEKEDAKRDVEALTKTVQNIVKISVDTASMETQIRDLSSQQESVGLAVSLEELDEQSNSLGDKTRSTRALISKLTADKERTRGQISAFELELSNLKAKLAGATHQLEKKTNIVARAEELKQLNLQQRETMKHAETDIQDLVPQIAKAQSTYDDISQRAAEKEKKLQQEAAKLSDSVRQLNMADEDINAYVKKGGRSQLERSQRDAKNYQQETDRLEHEQRQIVVEINKATDQLKNNEETKRSISDNLRFRRDVRGLEAINVEIQQLEERNAEADRGRFVRKAQELDLRHSRLSAEQASKMGAMKSKDDQLAELLEDWNTDYKDAGVKFKEAHIKVETTKAAVEDLGRYGSALDKAIMKYHGLKMEEINRIIEELWKRTYQGTDVDTILIRSDNENAKGNRSYNYRVCMVKQDAEMDMRGRCSAGQKVLASIIIRLALAECFGVNCGLIALDEPTTNLDRDNIRSLADSLHHIITVRQQQSNFQLIVITHDEDFLRYMKCNDFCDNYYRVSRNEKQKSIIERQSINEVM